MRTRLLGTLSGLLLLTGHLAAGQPDTHFRRSDVNTDTAVDLSDALSALAWLFTGGPEPSCVDAADTNDDGLVDITDPIALLAWAFNGGPPPAPPGPFICGPDPTSDTLDCKAYSACLQPPPGGGDGDGDLDDIVDLLSETLDAEPDERRLAPIRTRLEEIEREMAGQVGNEDPAFRLRILEDLDEMGFDIGAILPDRQDEIGFRTEPELGDYQGSDSDWLSTESPNFVNIKKPTFFRGSFETVNGRQLVSSFVATSDDTRVAVTFSAEAHVSQSGKRMFVRALIDGELAEPSDVVFAQGELLGPRSFTFAAEVDEGVHTAEIQWLVDDGATGYLRDASLLVRTGKSISAGGTLTVLAAQSGAVITKNTQSWSDVPGQGHWVYVPQDAVVAATFSGESSVTGGKRFFLRAVISGDVASPSNVVFARGSSFQSRSMTFGLDDVEPGWRWVKFQWLVDDGGEARLGDRTLVVTTRRVNANQPTHAFLAAPSGASVERNSTSFATIPDMGMFVYFSEPGKGEVAVVFSAEAATTSSGSMFVRLRVDAPDDPGGILAPPPDPTLPEYLEDPEDMVVEFVQAESSASVKSFVFGAKHLSAGWHKITLEWRATQGSTAILGDRSMLILSEPGAIPDIAEPLFFGPGRLTGGDNLTGLEPVIGERDVLTILWDPHRTGEPDQTSIPKADVTAALFGNSDSARDYFEVTSGGRFTIRNAGVLGWYDAEKPAVHYWNHPDCEGDGEIDDIIIEPPVPDFFESGHSEKYTEALRFADDDFDFSAYDRNADGVLSENELAIVIVIPQEAASGSSARHRVYSQECPSKIRLSLDGVLIASILEWYTDLEDDYDYVVAAHELGHQILGLDDLYFTTSHVAQSGRYDLMSSSGDFISHIGGPYKLALGWARPTLLESDGLKFLTDVKVSEDVYILPRRRDEKRVEYFALENRQSDLAPGLYDESINDSGIAVWHVIERANDMLQAPRGVSTDLWSNGLPPTIGRMGIRLLRPWTATGPVADYVSSESLWDSEHYDLLSADCPAGGAGGGIITGPPAKNTLTWADCTGSGYNILNISGPGEQMTFQLELD